MAINVPNPQGVQQFDRAGHEMSGISFVQIEIGPPSRRRGLLRIAQASAALMTNGSGDGKSGNLAVGNRLLDVDLFHDSPQAAAQDEGDLRLLGTSDAVECHGQPIVVRQVRYPVRETRASPVRCGIMVPLGGVGKWRGELCSLGDDPALVLRGFARIGNRG